jgi:hypothetical protein
MSFFANTDNTQINNETYEYQRKNLNGKFTKIGISFSWFTKNEVTCKPYVVCARSIRIETIVSGEAEINKKILISSFEK